MANRLTDSRKWSDPWFCSLSTNDKLFWFYLLDSCDHAGIWKVNLPLVSFFIKGYTPDLNTFSERIKVINDEKWFIESFVLFQQKINDLSDLNPLNKCHASIISILTKEGVFSNKDGSPCQGASKPLPRGQGIGIGKGKGNKGGVGGNDEEFLEKMRKIYSYADFDKEMLKMDAWLLTKPGRKKTRRFIVNWMNKIDRPIKEEKQRIKYINDTEDKPHTNLELAELIHKTAKEMK